MEKFLKKKSLGQNFLKDKSALKKIADAAEIMPGETILEIGPGEGDLTAELLNRGANVVAIEKDQRLIPILEEKFSGSISAGVLKIIYGDVLTFQNSFAPGQYKLVANIPYYITGELIRLALSTWPQPSKCVLLVQKEVAERIAARDGKESILSISVKVFGKPKVVATVPAGAFSPAPNVDSAILKIDEINRINFEKVDEKAFFEIVKTGFAHKRKMLGGNLKALFGENLENKLQTCGISTTVRSEDLTVEKWLCLAKN